MLGVRVSQLEKTSDAQWDHINKHTDQIAETSALLAGMQATQVGIQKAQDAIVDRVCELQTDIRALK